MLVEFRLTNYRSIRDEVRLSLVASSDRSFPENVTRSAQGTKLNLLRSVGIYGANASGKTNLLHGLRFMQQFVGRSATEGQRDAPIQVVPFWLDQRWQAKPSEFEVVFLRDGVRYAYGFAADSSRVHREWLSSYPLGQERVLFERGSHSSEGQAEIYFGPHWEGPGRSLVRLVRPNALFVSVASQFNNPSAQLVSDWFSQQLRMASWFPADGSELRFTVKSAHDKDNLRRRFLSFLKEADLGITDFSVKEIPMCEGKQWKRLPEPVREALDLPSNAVEYATRTMHHGLDKREADVEVSFDLEDESDGTKKLFALAGPWEFVLEHGCTLYVDELEARLHPLLTEWLVRRFHANQTHDDAQLIFATHDANLLQSDLFRRDQVWFTEKGPDGETQLYSLWDYKKLPRRRENLMRGYLAGRYGAIPLVEDRLE